MLKNTKMKHIEQVVTIIVIGMIVTSCLFVLVGCSTLKDSDERTLLIDCNDCEVKYRMSLDVDKTHIKEHIK